MLVGWLRLLRLLLRLCLLLLQSKSLLCGILQEMSMGTQSGKESVLP